MKLTIVLLTAVCLQAAAKTNAQNISLSEKSISLEKALQKIKAQSGYEFFYDRKILSLAKEPISVKLANGTLNQALDLCFKDQPKLTYSIVGKVIVVRKKVNPSVIEALTTTADLDFAGVVVHITDSAGLPLRGATVRVEGTSLVGQSDDKGNVSFTNVPDNAKLVISYVGYQTINIRTGGKSDIAVTLQPAVSVQTEVVVVGYGTQKRLTVTGSVAQVKGEDLVKSPAANLSNTLAGRIPGLSAFNTSGQPGADGANILIRGVNSFGNTGALVVIDGVPDRAGGLERLASGDIESVSVLKDASAAIYGQRSANGVILITTKRGKAGKTSVTYSFNQGISQLTEVPKMMNSTQYGTVVNELAVYPLNVNPSTWSTIFHGLQTNGTYSYTDLSGNPATIVSPAGFAPTDMQKYKDGSDPWGHPNTDWYGAVLAKWAPQQRHNLQMTGGTDNIKYLVSMGYLNQDGNYKNSATRYKQYDLRANVDFKLNKYINFVVGVLGREENRLNPTQSPGTIFRFITRGTPNLQAYWPNGLPGPDLESGNQPVLLSTNATGYDKDVRDYYQSNGKIEIRIPWVEGLKLTGTASVDKYQRNEKIWQQPWYEYTWDGTTYQADGKTPQLTKVQKSSTPNAQPSLSQNYENQTGVTLTGMLNYDHKFGNHTIAFMAGVQNEDLNDAYAGVYRAFFLSTAVQVLNAGSSIQQNISGSEYERRHLGYFGRVGYNYKEKYLAEFLWREDGSYIFPPNSRFGFFPGVSLGWRISEEGFFKNNVRFVDNLKFRASYGQVGAEPYLPGTTNLAEFQYLSSYNQGNIAFNGTVLPGLAEGVAPNNTFTWERQKNLNFGLDGTVLNNKLNFTVDVFSNRRDKALLPPLGTVPATAIPGSQLPPVNYGSLQNRGWEFSVDYHNTTSGGLKYSIGANAGYAQNKVLVFDEAPGVPDNQKQVGKPYQANVAFVYDGVFKDASEINGAMGTSSSGKQLDYSALVSTLRPGDMKFKDISGPNGKPDGVIDHYDQERLTKNTNFKMTYGITLNLQYKGFDASFLFQGATGGLADIYTESGLIGNFLASDYSHRWSIDNPSSVYPRLADRANTYYTDRSSGGSGGHNTYNLKSTNYLRLKNLEIGYTLPSTITRKAAINTLRFYVNATNLVTFSKMKDFDPEIYGGGNYLGQYYPQLRVISFGATVNF